MKLLHKHTKSHINLVQLLAHRLSNGIISMGLPGTVHPHRLSPIDGAEGLSGLNYGDDSEGVGSVVQCAGLILSSEEVVNGMIFQGITFEIELHTINASDDLPKNTFGSAELQHEIRMLVSKHSRVYRRTLTPVAATISPLVLTVVDAKWNGRAQSLPLRLQTTEYNWRVH